MMTQQNFIEMVINKRIITTALIIISGMLILAWIDPSCSDQKVKISYVSCFSTFETWIDKKEFELLNFKKDTTICLKEMTQASVKKILTGTVDSSIKKIDIRVKVVFYKKNKVYKTVYLDNAGDFMICNKFYKKNNALIDFIKKNSKGIDCW